MEEAGEDFRNSWTQIAQKDRLNLRNMRQSLRGNRLGGNQEDMKPNKPEFDPCVAKIGKLAGIHSEIEVMLTKQKGTFTSLTLWRRNFLLNFSTPCI